MKTTDLFKKGQKAKNLSPDEQREFSENVERGLQIESEENQERLKLQGSIIVEEMNQHKEDVQRPGQPSRLEHTQSTLFGILLTGTAAFGFAGEAFLTWWTFFVLQIGTGEGIVAISFLIFGFLALELYLGQVEKVLPESYQKFMLYGSVTAIVCVCVSLFLIAEIRGGLVATLQTVTNAGDLEAQLEGANRFHFTASHALRWLMPFIALAGLLACGLCMHQGLRRLIVSIPTLIIYRGIAKLARRQAAMADELKKWESWPQKGMAEFKAGLLSEREQKPKRNWVAIGISPLTIIGIVLLIFTLIALSNSKARGADLVSVNVILDLSQSELSENHQGEEEFVKNVEFVTQVITKLEPNTEFKVIGLTERSFARPYVILGGHIPKDKGFFNEKVAKAKLDMINTWKGIELKATAKTTDVFGSINLAYNLFPENAKIRKLVILGDMRECAREFDLENPPTIDLKNLTKVESQGLIPPLNGVQVWILGAHPCGRTEAYYNSLKMFWLEYFKKAGAHVVSYRMDRRWDNE